MQRDLPLTSYELDQIVTEITEQPKWRATADKEMDYADGNQLDSDLLRRQAELGIPPAIEDLISPALLAVQGYEATIRTDWRVTADGEEGGQDVADALNYKLNKAERESGADRACSDAFRAQIGCGIGWVEVSKQSDPFQFPYRCLAIHRNEIHWDMRDIDPMLRNARWLRRQRWLPRERVMLTFPQHAELIDMFCRGGGTTWYAEAQYLDGGQSTGLNNAWHEARAYTHQEERHFNPTNNEVCLTELWYRRWVQVPVLKTPDGRVVEYDPNNQMHQIAVATGKIEPILATVTKMRRSFWLGAHCLFDGESPYSHHYFPYVPFWGFREDNTGVPYGYVRGMKYQQDAVNSGIAKMRWLMNAVLTIRTDGAIAMTDSQFRQQVGRSDADIVLDAAHMAMPGARFEVTRDFQLTDQHHQMIENSRAAIERVSGITAGFSGRQGSARSGLQEQTQVEQSNQALARMMDNFRAARSMVGELLLSMIIDDIGTNQQTIIIEGDALKPKRSVVINAPERNPVTNEFYLSNDVQRTRLKVALEDVPSTNSYRAQQLNAFSEAIKSLPAEYQAVMMPFMMNLMDVPYKNEVIEAVKGVQQQQTPEQIEQAKQEAIQQALKNAQYDLKQRELEMKQAESEAKIKEIVAKAVQIGVQSAFSATQGAAQIAQMPMIAPIADQIMAGAGYEKPNPMGDDPNLPTPEQAAAMHIRSPYIQGQGAQVGSEQLAQAPEVRENTSPNFPPLPQQPETGLNGIETAEVTDNLPQG